MDNEYFVYKRAVALRVSVLLWLGAMKYPKAADYSKGKVKQLGETALPWVAAPMASAFLIPFDSRRWTWFTLFWSLKLTAGFVGLFCMTLYWDAYANFRLEPNEEVGAVYNGWNLLGFAYAWRPTREATFKKGLQRAVVTVLGSFMAWLGVIVCSWSYDEDAEINPYGFTAWLIVVTMMGAGIFTLDSGLGSLMGQSKDYGYIGMYFGMTLCLIGLEIYVGNGSRDALTVNRMVATLSGVAMAIVLSVVPPYVDGTDPQHTRDYLAEISKAFDRLLVAFVDEEDASEFKGKDFKTSLLEASSKSRRKAVFLL